MMKGSIRVIVGKDAKMQDLLSRFFPKGHTGFFHGFLKSQLGPQFQSALATNFTVNQESRNGR